MELTDLFVHPVKSAAPRPLAAADVLARGLADDRSWVLVDDRGVLVSARELPALMHVVADTALTDPSLAAARATTALRVWAPGHEPLRLPTPEPGQLTPFRMFSENLAGVPAGPEADAWFRAVLGRDDLSLLWCDDPSRRRLVNELAAPEDHTGYADAAPVSLASRASLARLNEWIAEEAGEQLEEPAPVAMQRFRPNLVIDGDEPFAEDRWSEVQIGDVRFQVVGRIGRCVMTTIEPTTLARGKEPLRTLARHRRQGKRVVFAVELIPQGPGTLRIGDAVRPTARSDDPGR